MDRKKFIKTSGFACLGAVLVPQLLSSCASLSLMQKNHVQAEIQGSDLIVPIRSFERKGKPRLYVVANHDKLKYPICIYKFSEKEYIALLMACTHQGAELQVFGDKLECPAHGSEFSNRGVVENGPADTNLRELPVQVEPDQLKVSLS